MENIIYEKFVQVVNTYPDQPAVIENNRTMSFADLSGMVDMIAKTFPDDLKAAGIVMTHRAEMIAAMLAVLKCGTKIGRAHV